jgi:L-fuconolactonase
VQVEQTEKETMSLVEDAKKHSFIKGVVGWVDFRSDKIAERLQFFKQFSILKGFRHIVQAEPVDFLYNENFRQGIDLLRQYNYTYDILVYPHQLKAATDFAAAFPDQKFVLDHLAKPYIKDRVIDEWKNDLKELAGLKNVCCKISGMVTEADWQHHSYNDFVPYMEVVAETFGIDRIMFGSDWPVCLVADTYENVLSIVTEFFKSFPKENQEKFFALNAIQFYNLNV